jgi:flagella basal body P-ring formation protein FlgA
MRSLATAALAASLLLPSWGAAADPTDDAIGALVRDRLAIQGAPVLIDIVYDPPLPAALAEAKGPVSVPALRFDRMSGRFAATVRQADGTEIAVGGIASATVDVPVLSRSLQRGEAIAEEDVDYAILPAAALSSGFVLDPAGLAGKAAKRRLQANRPVRAADLMAPIVVAKNTNVNMIYAVGALRISARGRALSNAGEGETVLVLNTGSKKTVEAVVLDAYTVVVGMAPPAPQP